MEAAGGRHFTSGATVRGLRWGNRTSLPVWLRIPEEQCRYPAVTLKDTKRETASTTSLDPNPLLCSDAHSPRGLKYYCRCVGNDLSSRSLQNCRFSVERRGQGGNNLVMLTAASSAATQHVSLVQDITESQKVTRWTYGMRNDEEKKNPWFMLSGDVTHFAFPQATGTVPTPEVQNPLNKNPVV